MLKKFKCIETKTAALANSSQQYKGLIANVSRSNAVCSNTTVSETIAVGEAMKIIKSEPIDYDEMLLMDANHQDSCYSSKRIATEIETARISPRHQHVQIQTVAPRQPTILSNLACPSATVTQKVTVAPYVEYMHHAPLTRLKKQSHQQVLCYNTSHYQEPERECEPQNFTSSPHESNNSSNLMTSQVLTNVRMKTGKQHHYQQQVSISIPQSTEQLSGRSHSTMLSGNSSRITLVSSNTAPSSPPLQQHVRVIRDGRLYDENFASHRDSVSPPPLHYSQQTQHDTARSAPLSPIGTSLYRLSMSDQIPPSTFT